MTPEQIAAVIAQLRARGAHRIDLGSPGSGHETEFFPDALCAEAAAMLTALLAERDALLRVAEVARTMVARAMVRDERHVDSDGIPRGRCWMAVDDGIPEALVAAVAALGSNADAQ